MSHIHNIFLFRVKFGLEKGRARFFRFTICPFPYNVIVYNPLFILSYHPVQKGLDFVPSKQRCAYDNSIDKFFQLNSRGTHLEYFHTNPIFRIWSEMVRWAELSLSAISDVVGKGSCSNIALTTSSSIKDGRPERGLSERKSPVSNFSYHLVHVLSETVPSPLSINFYMLL